jgi:8-oxo-dGTP pyrophosphatase MutT (NUDIX family)
MRAMSSRDRTDAAVLVPLYRRASDASLRCVLLRRAEGGVHGGQIAFPGGKPESRDADLLATAVREAHEEVGLDPDYVTILAALPIVNALTTGFRVHPFLARIDPPAAWTLDPREVIEVIDAGVEEELAPPEAHGWEMRREPAWDRAYSVQTLRLRGHVVWGLTYRILTALLPRLRAGEWHF